MLTSLESARMRGRVRERDELPALPTSRRRQMPADGHSEFERRVRGVIAGLRMGEVATYGEVAEEAGFPGAARAVGNILARGSGLPWWRVVSATGRLVPGHEDEQAHRLRREGLSIEGARIRRSKQHTDPFPKRSPRRID